MLFSYQLRDGRILGAATLPAFKELISDPDVQALMQFASNSLPVSNGSWPLFFNTMAESKRVEQLKLLTVLRTEGKITTPRLMRILGTKAWGGIGSRIREIRSACKLAGLNPDSILTSVYVSENGKSVRQYQAGKMLIENELPPVPDFDKMEAARK